MQLVLDTKGLQLTKKGRSFEVISPNGVKKISPAKLDSIAITASVLLSADAIRLAIDKEIPILFFDNIGKAKARLWSPYFQSIATLRRMQIKFAEDIAATDWVIDLFILKTRGQAQNLRYLKNRIPGQTDDLQKTIQQIEIQARNFEQLKDHLVEEVRSQFMGIEGKIAAMYWQTLGQTLPFPYNFNKRSRRPATDLFNAALNYLYGMTYSVVEGGLFAAGLDPHLGILHADEYNKPTLAFDLIEIFRPWVDRLLIDLCLQEELQSSHFTKNQHGLFLNKNGKAIIIPAFNDWLRAKKRFMNQEATHKNQIYRLANLLARRIRTHGSLQQLE